MQRILTMAAVIVILSGCQKTSTKDDDDSAALAPAKPVAQAKTEDLTKTSDSAFAQDVLNSKEPVLVDFNTSWCGPCKMMEPILSELATEYKGKLKFVSIDAEKNPIAAQKYSVTGYPTFLIFRNGKMEKQIIGAKSKLQMQSLISEARVL